MSSLSNKYNQYVFNKYLFIENSVSSKELTIPEAHDFVFVCYAKTLEFSEMSQIQHNSKY